MENNSNRRLLILIGFVLFFVIIVLVWYFYYAKQVISPTLNETKNPLAVRIFPPHFQFLNWKDTPSSTSTTEIIDPTTKPLVEIWNKPATGQTFITEQVLKEIISSTTTIKNASTTQGTSTSLITNIKRTVRATTTIVTFVDKVTGYIYGYPIETGKVFQISNSIIPGVSDAYFFDNGKHVIMRYIDYEKNTVVGLIATIPNVSQTGTALPLENIQYLTGEVLSVAINARKDKASYIVGTDNGSTIYTITPKGPALVTSSPFKEWSLSYGGDSLFVTTRPSAYVEGATLSVPRFQSEITEKTGLMSLPSPTGSLLNSMWGSKGLVTFYSDNSGTKVLPITTLAPKCAWGNNNLLACAVPRVLAKTVEGLPDDWYQGRISFSDDLVIVDTTRNEKSPLYTFTNEDGIFDVIGITISKENDLFSFTKRQDGTLWLLNTNFIPGE